jgi:5'-3' exoribonuclease 1
VNLLPFIDIKLLKETIAEFCPSEALSPAERKRNSIGHVFCYRHDNTCTDTVEAPLKSIGLPDIISSQSSVSVIEWNVLGDTSLTFRPHMIPGTKLPYPGFPSLNVLPMANVELVAIGLNCFGTPSKYPTMILSLYSMPELPPLDVLADNILGKSLFINWPLMHEGKLVAISDVKREIRLENGKQKIIVFSQVDSERWQSEAEAISQAYYSGNGRVGSGGVQIGEIKIRLRLLPLQGMKTNPSNGSTKKVFGKQEADVPLQLALWQAPAPDPRFIERGPMTLKDRFPEGCRVILTKGKNRGCLGTVVGIADEKTVGVKVQTLPPELPFGLAIARSVQDSYLSSVDAARILKMNPGVFGKVMGRLQFVQGKYDLGLNLKSADGSCVVGYTRKKVEASDKKGRAATKREDAWAAGDSVLVVGSRTEVVEDDDNDERIQWEYTPNAVRLVEAYRNQFPQLFSALNKKPNERRYDAIDVFGPNGEAMLPVIREWLNNHETAKLPRSPVTTNSMSVEAAMAVQKAADVRTLALKKKGFPKECLFKIPGSALYREGSTGPTDVLLASDLNEGRGPELGDRVVNLCADGVPFGARGTIIGIHDAAKTGSVEVLMDEEFIGGTSLQGHCANFRGKLCLWPHLLKITADNTEALVDKLVSHTQKHDPVDRAVGKIISTAQREAKTSNIVKKSSNNQNAKQLQPEVLSKPHSSYHATPNRSSSRTGSTGRNRGAWREARGPDEKGVGFKMTKKGAPSGLTKWKNAIKSKPSRIESAVSIEDTAASLKKILNIPNDGTKSKPVTTGHADSVDNHLKAILGVSSTVSSTGKQEQSSQMNPSEGLKAILGVSTISNPENSPPRVQPATAADKLLQMMTGRQSHPSNFQNIPVQSSFNFTYVEEGKEVAPPPQPPMMALPYPNFSVPPQMNGPIPHYVSPGYGFPQPPNFNPQFAHVAPGPPLDEFPPINGSAKSDLAKKKKSRDEKKVANAMIPSAIASKGKKVA